MTGIIKFKNSAGLRQWDNPDCKECCDGESPFEYQKEGVWYRTKFEVHNESWIELNTIVNMSDVRYNWQGIS